MTARTAAGRRVRRRRGRPGPHRSAPGRRGGQPTRARLIALRVLERVQRAGAYADLALHASLGRSDLGAPDRAFATDLVYGTLRWRGRIDFLLSRVLDRDLDRLEPLVATALRLGAYQLCFADRVPATAAVDEAVRCVRAAGVDRASGLVNAVLRRLARERDQIALPSLEEHPLEHLVHALSLPEWIARRWLQQWGAEEAAALARASNQPAPLAVRVNRRRADPAGLLRELAARFPDARECRLAEGGLVLGRRGNPARDPAFLDGRFTVQDEASQLVVQLLDPQPGECVLDTCAAPGGKATACAERVGDAGLVLAVDRHARRLDLVRRDARRLGLSALVGRERDATQPLQDLGQERAFDRVLVDAPCSGLGTLRRNPDARWRVGPEDPARLAQTQRAILAQAAAALRPGGVLVYSTCTLTPEENEDIVREFLASSRDSDAASAGRWELGVPSGLPDGVRAVVDDEGFMRCLPHRHDTDGFFAARLERRA